MEILYFLDFFDLVGMDFIFYYFIICKGVLGKLEGSYVDIE